MVPRNDNILIGLVVSLLVPFGSYFLLLEAQDFFAESAGRPIIFEQRTVALIAICLNVMPLNFFRKVYRNRSLRGLATGTMILALTWFFWFGRALL
ncbi:MAG: hypothetical protein ACI81P_002598 [Neolewinella sp.]|jgi:hypothetical protein